MESTVLDQLLECHVQHIVSKLDSDSIQKVIETEVTEAFGWLGRITLAELADQQLVADAAVRLLQHSPYTAGLHKMLVKGILVGINADINNETTLETLVPKSEYDKVVSHMAQFEQLRIDVIRAILASPIYSRLISDVLYHGIKDYMSADNVIAKKVPGVSSLMKMGAKTVNKAMPNIEAQVESTVKKYIQANINRTLSLSEKILNNSLDADNIKKVADHFWQEVATKEFAKAAEYVREEDVDRGIEMGRNLWLEMRQSQYLSNLVVLMVDHVFSEYGDRKMDELLNDLGFDQVYVISELRQSLPGMIDKPVVKAYLEERAREHLKEFYHSDQAKALLES